MEILYLKYNNQNKNLSGLKFHFQDVKGMKSSTDPLPSEKIRAEKQNKQTKTIANNNNKNPNHLEPLENVQKAYRKLINIYFFKKANKTQ